MVGRKNHRIRTILCSQLYVQLIIQVVLIDIDSIQVSNHTILHRTLHTIVQVHLTMLVTLEDRVEYGSSVTIRTTTREIVIEVRTEVDQLVHHMHNTILAYHVGSLHRNTTDVVAAIALEVHDLLVQQIDTLIDSTHCTMVTTCDMVVEEFCLQETIAHRFILIKVERIIGRSPNCIALT